MEILFGARDKRNLRANKHDQKKFSALYSKWLEETAVILVQ